MQEAVVSEEPNNQRARGATATWNTSTHMQLQLVFHNPLAFVMFISLGHLALCYYIQYTLKGDLEMPKLALVIIGIPDNNQELLLLSWEKCTSSQSWDDLPPEVRIIFMETAFPYFYQYGRYVL